MDLLFNTYLEEGFKGETKGGCGRVDGGWGLGRALRPVVAESTYLQIK
jgi:hypothetical protein